jgi:hypothetical protein
MANENETIADIIAEMLGARTEFPFVYLMGEPDTPEVIDFKTKAIIEPRKINIRRVTVKELADRLEAAHKGERGDCAKLREALKMCVDELCARCRDLAKAQGDPMPCLNGCEPVRNAKAALAAPPRNCDKYPTFNDAIRALADKRGWHDEKWDSERYCILASWLFAPATEKEGGAK